MEKGIDNYRDMELFKNYSTNSTNYIYNINFSRKPLRKEPSGHCSLSHINKVDLYIGFNDVQLPYDNLLDYNVSIYNRFYNILELKSGRARFLYFK